MEEGRRNGGNGRTRGKRDVSRSMVLFLAVAIVCPRKQMLFPPLSSHGAHASPNPSLTTTTGFPRIGPNREMKKALER